MFSELYSESSFLSGMLETKLNTVRESNAERKRIEKNYNDLASAFSTLENKLSITQEMLREINITLKDYKKHRKTFIEESISKNLEYVLKEGYSVELSITPYKDKTKVSLLLWSVDTMGNRVLYVPSEQNGGLCRQIITTSFGMAVADLLGCKILFLDEAFNGGDSEKLERVQLILAEWISNGGQIVLNEHNPSVYTGMACRVYDIDKVGKGFEGYIEVKEVTDMEGLAANERGFEQPVG